MGPYLSNLTPLAALGVNSLGVTMLCSNELPERSWDFAR
jgi:hypothetical protein